MKWDDLLNIVRDKPLFSTAFLTVGRNSQAAVQLQLSRWTKAGKIIKLRRGLYMLSNPYRKIDPHSFLISNYMKPASYISLQSALSYYGMIPEHVPVITAVTTQRPEFIQTEMGVYMYKHIKNDLFSDFVYRKVVGDQSVFIATPEKCLIDLIYMTSDGDNLSFLSELRLQNTEILNFDVMRQIAEKSKSPKLLRAVNGVQRIIEHEDYVEL